MRRVSGKKNITLDARFWGLIQSYHSHHAKFTLVSPVVNAKFKEGVGPRKLVCIMKRQPTEEIPHGLRGDLEIYRFRWAHTIREDDPTLHGLDRMNADELLAVRFSNNLDSFLGYTEYVCAQSDFIFALLECVRVHMGVDKVWEIDDDSGNIWVLI